MTQHELRPPQHRSRLHPFNCRMLRSAWLLLIVTIVGLTIPVAVARLRAPVVPHLTTQTAVVPMIIDVLPLEAHHRFVFRNSSGTSVRIAKVETTCSCTAHEYTTEPIEPGEIGFIHVSMAMYKSGPKTTQTKVLWSTGEETVYTLEGHARALAELGTSTRRINVRPGETAVVDLWLTTLAVTPPELSVEGATADLSVSADRWKVISAGQVDVGINRRYASRISVKAGPDATEGTDLHIRAPGAEPLVLRVRIIERTSPNG